MTGGGARELLVLGTSAQVPTRARHQNGYLLRWDADAILFDPGEGTQRRLLDADASTRSLTAIAITHFHGDHCLGLPGVLGRLTLDRRSDPLDLYFPASGSRYVERLRHAAMIDPYPHLRLHPLPMARSVIERPGYRLVAEPLDHSVDTLGYRVEEDGHRHVDGPALDRLGVTGPDVGRLLHAGSVRGPFGTVRVDEVSAWRPGQSFAFVMDTATCDGAFSLAEDADLLVCESTFLESDGSFARDFRHLTARQAGWVAAESGAHHLLLTHFSARHPDNDAFVQEALDVAANVTAAEELTTVAIRPRSRVGTDTHI